MSDLQIRYTHPTLTGGAWEAWSDLHLPWTSPLTGATFEIREKPLFVPGWFQDYSQEAFWADREEQGRIRWFDFDPTLGGSLWRRVEVKILDDPDQS